MNSMVSAVLGGKVEANPCSNPKDAKRRAAEVASEFVRPQMALGLGTGSTAAEMVDIVGRRYELGELPGLEGMPSSERTAEQASRWGIPLLPLGKGRLDLAIDGADEACVGPEGQIWLIKGGGGAMLRERVVIDCAQRFLCIVDIAKCSARLGTLFALPVECEVGAVDSVSEALIKMGASPSLRVGEAGVPYRTDNGNPIVDARFADGIEDPERLARELGETAGVLEHGLFLAMATELVVAFDEGVETVKSGTLIA